MKFSDNDRVSVRFRRRFIGGVVVWLNAERGPTMLDLSGNGNHPTINSAPTLTTGGPGGRPFWRFNGATPNYVTFPDVFSALTVAEVFTVFKRTDNTSGHDGLWTFGSAGADTRIPFPGDGKIYDDWGTTVRKDTGVPAAGQNPVNQFIVYNVRSKANAWTSWINGAQFFNTATNTVGFKTSCIWGKGPTVLGYFDSPELLIINRELSSAERASVAADLMDEYRIT